MAQMTKKTNVVYIGGISLLRSFSKLPVNLILVARNKKDVVLFSREYDSSYVIADPLKEPDKVINQLVDIARQCDNAPVLYYAEDIMLLLISRNRERLQKYYKFLMPDTDLIENCADKLLFSELARKHDLPVPQGMCAHKIENITDIENTIGFPCIVKPLLKEGRPDLEKLVDGKPQKALLVKNHDELKNFLEAVNHSKNNFILQEYISGGEDQIYSFHAYADENSKPIEYYVGKKIRTYPSTAGVSTSIELVENLEVVRLGTEILQKLKVKGPIKIDFKKDIVRNKLYLLELNLRYSLWNSLGTYCGINLIEVAYKYNCEIPYEPVRIYKTGILWLALRNDYRSFVEDYRPAGELTLISWLGSLMRARVYSVFSWRDPLPAIVANIRYWGRIIKRLFGKLSI